MNLSLIFKILKNQKDSNLHSKRYEVHLKTQYYFIANLNSRKNGIKIQIYFVPLLRNINKQKR